VTELAALKALEQLGHTRRRELLVRACRLARERFVALGAQDYPDPELCEDALRHANDLHAVLLELERGGKS
jgi:hypothetical protein